MWNFSFFGYNIFVFLSFKKQKIKYIKLADIAPKVEYTANIEHPIICHCNDDVYNWERLRKSMRRYGQKTPLVLRKLTEGAYKVIDGGHRLRVMKELYPPDKKVRYVDESTWFWMNYNAFEHNKYKQEMKENTAKKLKELKDKGE